MLTRWGVLRYWRVAIKLAMTIGVDGAVLFVVVSILGRAADAAAAAAPFSDAQRLLLVVGPAVAITQLLLAAVLAVFKPSWRLRGRPTARVAPGRECGRRANAPTGRKP